MARIQAAPAPQSAEGSDLGAGLYGIAKSIEGIGDEFGKMYYVEQIADHLAELATATDGVSQALAAAVIAEHGTDEDRARVLEHLKGWFWRSEVFRDR